jgi:hypothetical protein
VPDVKFLSLQGLTALVAAAATLAVGLAAGAQVAGGADSAGYLAQARLWTEGRLHVTEPVSQWARWPIADWTLSPLGYRPGTSRGTIVPFYPPGYPLAMASTQTLARTPRAVFVVVPLLGALAVWLTFLVGRRLHDPATGMWAALLLAANPVFLFQLVQPMSDVPATAWWLAVAVLVTRPGAPRGAVWSLLGGLAASAAILTRPNTAPLALVPAVWIALGARADVPRRPNDAARLGTGARLRAGASAWFVAGLLPGLAALAWFNDALYGSPFRSGYAGTGISFSIRHAGANLSQYAAWLWQTHDFIILLGILALAVIAVLGVGRRRTAVPGFGLYATGFVGILFGSYVLFTPFDNWTYLRYLLPAFPLLAVFGVWLLREGTGVVNPGDAGSHEASDAALAGSHGHAGRRVAGILLAVLVADSLWMATRVGVLDVKAGERRYPEVAGYFRRQVGADRIVIGLQHTGSLRYYAGATTVRFDLLDHEWLDRAVAAMAAHGRGPVVVLEEWEEALFRERFKGQSWGALDWPPRVQFDGSAIVHLYDPTDRALYRQGLAVPTTHIRVR